MYSLGLTIFAFLLAIIILVAFHEYGHFKVARLCGIKVLKFCIGFGPAVIKKRDKYNTDFILAPIPLGGYVKMLDEREGEVPESEKHLEFNSKKPWQKMAVVAAGPIFNFILAIIVFFVMFFYGIQVERPVIQYIEPGSIAQRAGIMSNTEIVAIDDEPVYSFTDVQIALAAKLGTNDSVKIKTKSFDYAAELRNKTNTDKQNYTIQEYSLTLAGLEADLNKEPVSRAMGIWLLPKDTMPLLVDSISSESNAVLTGLQVGDVITKYNNNSIDKWDDFLAYIKNNPDQDIQIVVQRKELTQKLNLTIGNKDGSGFLGVSFRYPIYFAMQSYGIFDSLYHAVIRTYNYIVQTFYMMYKLVVGDIGIETVRGPVMVAKSAGVQLQIGISNFLNFLGIISIGLGVINLLPIPVLDGGHLVYHLYELITGRRVSELVEKISVVFGLIVLALIMSVAFYNDFKYW